jgi:hypothetical protein
MVGEIGEGVCDWLVGDKSTKRQGLVGVQHVIG